MNLFINKFINNVYICSLPILKKKKAVNSPMPIRSSSGHPYALNVRGQQALHAPPAKGSALLDLPAPGCVGPVLLQGSKSTQALSRSWLVITGAQFLRPKKNII